MSDIKALDKLIDAAGRGDDQGVHDAAKALHPRDDHWTPSDDALRYISPYHGSLDAAKALHEALLPERAAAEIRYSKRYSDESYVYINMPSGGVCQGRSTNPARAWLLAILKAYRNLNA